MGKVKYNMSRDISIEIECDIIADKKTKFQDLKIIDTTDFGRCMVLDGVIQLSEKDHHRYHESIVHPAMLSCENPKTVLVIGGGDGGILKEVFKYDVEKVVQCELDKDVVEASKEFMPEVSSGCFDDKRLKLLFADGRKFLEETEERFDVVLLDLTDPSGPSKFLFTKEFYSIVKSKLNEGGVVALDGEVLEPDGLFGNIVKTTEAVFKHSYPFLTMIPSYFVSLGFVVCSDENLDWMRDEDLVKKRIIDRKIQLKFFNAKDISRLFTKTNQIEDELKKDLSISTDANPVEVNF